MAGKIEAAQGRESVRTSAHKLVAETAKAMAHEVYDEVMRDNGLWKQWKRICPELTRELLEERFVMLLYPRLLESARATLARLLTTNIAEGLKADIHDALVKDQQFREGRSRVERRRAEADLRRKLQ